MYISDSQTQPCRKGSEAWFTGAVWLEQIAAPPSPSRVRMLRVTFEPGARTAWHTHPVGQTLHVLTGVGCIQKKGSKAEIIKPGDTIWIAPGELHWHGATSSHSMVHLAIQETDETGVDAVWAEHVVDEDYYRVV